MDTLYVGDSGYMILRRATRDLPFKVVFASQRKDTGSFVRNYLELLFFGDAAKRAENGAPDQIDVTFDTRDDYQEMIIQNAHTVFPVRIPARSALAARPLPCFFICTG